MVELMRRGGVGAFTGIITYKNAEAIRAAAKAQGLARLMIETDAPYLTPMPHRGKPNEPAFVRHTAEFCAKEVFGVIYEELAEATPPAEAETSTDAHPRLNSNGKSGGWRMYSKVPCWGFVTLRPWFERTRTASRSYNVRLVRPPSPRTGSSTCVSSTREAISYESPVWRIAARRISRNVPTQHVSSSPMAYRRSRSTPDRLPGENAARGRMR